MKYFKKILFSVVTALFLFFNVLHKTTNMLFTKAIFREKVDVIMLSTKLTKYKYAPNKYVIGIEGKYVAILKSDEKGNVKLESEKDISNINIFMLPKEDIELLRSGDKIYQYDTREDAHEALIGIFKS